MENKYFCPKCRLWTDYDVRPMSILFVIVCRACKSEYPALFQQQILAVAKGGLDAIAVLEDDVEDIYPADTDRYRL
ncbi:hypothetical protein Sulac_2151 [Sulfobacillus acidophilus DSM 10332]|uniref:Uncharacterized protein n=1 Tax=Sulfobacillus acidophilus (strain ATCC 700253 / DSM 10332 / NAL) TaxID=679936 RepID=G8TTG6_SULAD|nr:hypothetical protein Sulac_2151 [Sulfobacillus acidophilus DSM 10332]